LTPISLWDISFLKWQVTVIKPAFSIPEGIPIAISFRPGLLRPDFGDVRLL
jgi:hypothetical protein